MSRETDFERIWQSRLSECLERLAGADVRDAVMAGAEELSDDSSREDVVAWTRDAMRRLESLTSTETAREVLAGCACHYPREELAGARAAFEATGKVSAAHAVLQQKFERFLRDTLELDDELIREIRRRGWGLAGLFRDGVIVATKIPKSSNVHAYLSEPDRVRRRLQYCHCPRVRNLLAGSEEISGTYCYCGAGFYRDIWEEILQRPVRVKVLESVLAGDDVCRIAIELPSDLTESREPRVR